MNYILKTQRLHPLLLILITILILTWFTLPASAETNQPLEMKRLDLQIWPEYDDPRVLAIWDGSLINTSNKPFSGLVSFNIPKNVDIGMACEIVNGGGHSCQPYKLEDKDTYQVISWRTTKPIAPGAEYPIWLEYYYNPLEGYPDKTMTIDYMPFYKTQSLNLTVREPLNTTNFNIDSQSFVKTLDSEGFNNYTFNFQGINKDKPVQLKVSYTRSDKNSSVPPPQQPDYSQSAASSTGTAAGKPFFSSGGGMILVGLVVVAAIVGFISLTDSSRRRTVNRRTSQRNVSRGTNGPDKFNIKNLSPENLELQKMLKNGEISEETYRELIENQD